MVIIQQSIFSYKNIKLHVRKFASTLTYISKHKQTVVHCCFSIEKYCIYIFKLFFFCNCKWKFRILLHCPVVSVIKLSHLQVMTTATKLPTDTKKRNHITPFSALLHRLTRIDLLITYKAVHGLSPATFHFSVHRLKNVTPLSSPQKQTEVKKRVGLCWSLYISNLLYHHLKQLFCVFLTCLLLTCWFILLSIYNNDNYYYYYKYYYYK